MQYEDNQTRAEVEVEEGKDECAICLCELTATNFTSTECGHRFHSSCVFKSLMVRGVGCPLCRRELTDAPPPNDDDESEDEYDESDMSDSEADDILDSRTVSTVQSSPRLTCKQVAEKIISMGYTPADIMYVAIGRLDESEKNRYTRDFRTGLTDVLDSILDGSLPVDFRDTRTYASAVLNVPRTEAPGTGPRPI
jgi:hypothetical protein